MTVPAPTIGTHNGTFHCDEALACHMLRVLPRFSASRIVRTRDPATLSTLDVLVDVGAVYDPAALRFDHHQRTFSATLCPAPPRNRTKLSSAGLVYKHFGRDVITHVLRAAGDPAPADHHLDRLFDKDANFMAAVRLAGAEFDDCVLRVARSWLPARAIVAAAMDARAPHHPSGSILVMREWAPWKEHLFDLEREADQVGDVLYVVYKDMTGDTWRLQCVPVEGAAFESRKKLPEPWRGLRDDQLSQLTGIPKCVFVHAAGFIGGNLEFDGAMEMARRAIEMP
ncbi:unnamed protein product [Chondrus crispus]|uniref:Metal-dependent protein hydrolase n=1 Tax=Chondrus crispus TaxID=2769 RepID=R7Q4G0_CHOCR|nr:unnamed protein product [Chondrus crispus]CDF32246.1 unnamed protein product [Chondrus crispus]|eukprot:XP_005711911.1 unnamed protein product [Chondrus crispus]